jgi:four helix bundle protein
MGARDHKRLAAFNLADKLVPDVYSFAHSLVPEERFELASQIRRAAVSVPTNIVEGCAKPSRAEYVRFLTIASASASELRYLLELAHRLPVRTRDEESLVGRADEVCRVLHGLINSLERVDGGE